MYTNLEQAEELENSPSHRGVLLTFSGAVNVASADDTRLKLTDTGDSSELIFRSDGANTQIYTNTAHDLGSDSRSYVGYIIKQRWL
jgi:hypothetical protein